MKPLWIELVDDAVANRISFEDYDLIEMNWRLTNYPKLYRRIFEHELGHDEDNVAKDLTHDLKSTCPGLFKFMRENPSSWKQALPIYYSKRHEAWMYDWSAITSWMIACSLGLCVYWLLGGLL